MKYALSLLLGLLLGTASALALIYFNPLTRGGSAPDADAEWRFDYGLGAQNTWLSTHDKRIGIPVVPAGAPLLYEEGIKGSLLAAMPLADASGSADAAATRISVPSSETEFLRSGLLVEDHWLISVPGRGTIYVHAMNNHWPLLRDTVVRVDWLRREFGAPSHYEPTQGPADAGADVVGMTGTLREFRGHAHERLSLERYDGSFGTLTGRLTIDMADTGR